MSGACREMRLAMAVGVSLVGLLPGAPALALTLQQIPQSGVTTVTRETDSTATPGSEGEMVDRVVAIVNGELVLESDVEEEKRFAIFQPLSAPNSDFSRGVAIERLINRSLIVQQLKLQPQPPITDGEVDTELLQLRKDIPACKQAQCETDAGWDRFVEAQGFTMAEFRERWRTRMQVLRFIEQRFRMGVRISPDEIKTYYEKTLLPQYAKQKVSPPKLDAISDRIQEVLLQQQVGSLLGDWLKSLRVQGQIRIPGQGSGAAQ